MGARRVRGETGGRGGRLALGVALGAAATLLASAGPAWAQVTFEPLDRPAPFDGAVYRYRLTYRLTGITADRAIIQLPRGMQLFAIIDESGQERFSSHTPASCGAPPYQGCSVIIPKGSNCLADFNVALAVGSDQNQRIDMSSMEPCDQWPATYLVVRASFGSCTFPPVEFWDGFTPRPQSAQDSEYLSACTAIPPARLAGVSTAPAANDVPRGGGPKVFTLPATTSLGAAARINSYDDLTNADTLFQCRRIVNGVATTAFGNCFTGETASFVTVSVGSPYPASPLTLTLQAVNSDPDPGGPPEGDLELQLTVGLAPTSGFPSVVFPVEQTVTDFAIGPQDVTPLSAGGVVDVTVTRAQSSPGAFEPRTATFAVVSTNPPQYLALAQSWLQGRRLLVGTPPDVPIEVTIEGTHVNPRGAPPVTARLRIPIKAAGCELYVTSPTLLPGESTELEVRRQDGSTFAVDFDPTFTVESGGGSISVDPSAATRALYTAPAFTTQAHIRVDLPDGVCDERTLSADISVGAPACQLVASATTVGLGSVVELRLTRTDGGVLPQETTTGSWGHDGGGYLADDPRAPWRAIYTAPTFATTAHVTLQGLAGGAASDAVCAQDSVTATIEVVADVQVDLTVRAGAASREASGGVTPALTPGGLAHAEARLQIVSGSAPKALRVHLTADSAFKALGDMPRVAGAVGVAVTSPPRLASTAAVERWVDLLVQSGVGEALSDFSLMTRAAFACSRARVRIEVYRLHGSDEPIASDEAWADIACEPDLSESTIVGRVFHDKNGNGEQDEGEEGLPGVMVASSASVYAITDESGSYHLDRLTPGRQAIKIDTAGLPPGAQARPERREVTLTPGMYTRVSFPVQLASLWPETPLELVKTESGVVLAAGKVVYRATFISPFPGVLSARRGSERVEGVAGREGSSTQALDLPLSGSPHWLVSVAGADGRVLLWSFAVHAYRADGPSMLVVPWGPRLLASLSLRAVRTRGKPAIEVRGETVEALALDVLAGQVSRCTLQGDALHTPCLLGVEAATARAPAPSEAGQAAIAVSIDPPPDKAGDDPPALAVTLSAAPPQSHQFLVGIAGIEARGDVQSEGFAAAMTSKLLLDGGGSFFYKGTFDEYDLLVTAGADAHARDLVLREDGSYRAVDGVLGRLIGHDPRRVFRDLDPESFQPTYGDGSEVVDEREAGGRFFLRVQRGDSYLKWGGINTGIDDTEVGQYVRSLYGLGARIKLDDPEESRHLRSVVFTARPDSVAARDELVVTGSSLYFLSHRQIVEGSIRVQLETLDEVSGLPVRVVSLVEGMDFEADYAGGRITLDSALPYRIGTGSLTSEQLGGDRGRLLVDYEYNPGADLARDWTAGARTTGTYGPVSLGATAVGEFLGSDAGTDLSQRRYSLLGAHARLDLGEVLSARLEIARSDGTSHVAAFSSDGGLSFTEMADASTVAGEAAVVELRSHVGGATGTLYGRFREPGFADSRTAPGMALTQAGLRLQGEFPTDTSAYLQVDHRALTPAGGAEQVRELGMLGAAQRLGPVGLGLEGRYEAMPREDDARLVAGALVGYDVSPHWSFALKRRQLLVGDVIDDESEEHGPLAVPARGETAAGVTYLNGFGFAIGVDGGVTDARAPFGRLHATVPLVDGTEIYASYLAGSSLEPYAGGVPPAIGAGSSTQASQAGAAAPVAAGTAAAAAAPGDAASATTAGTTSTLVLGGARRLADGSRLFAEQHVAGDAAGQRQARSVGAEVPLGRGLAIGLTYERATLDPLDAAAADVTRDAGSLSGVYQGQRVSLQLATDGRYDDGSTGRLVQLGGHGRLDVALTDALHVAGGFRGAYAYRLSGKDWHADVQSWEGTLGFALRPHTTERVQIFGRYAYTGERRLETAATLPGSDAERRWVSELAHIGSTAVIVNVIPAVDVGPKLYYRYSVVSAGGDEANDQAVLAALRADWHALGAWDVAVEGRSCGPDLNSLGGRDEGKLGALAELSAHVMDWLILGAGYNFSEIATAGVRCNEPGARGVYLRAEAVY